MSKAKTTPTPTTNTNTNTAQASIAILKTWLASEVTTQLGLFAYLKSALTCTTSSALLDTHSLFTRSKIESDKLLKDDCAEFSRRQLVALQTLSLEDKNTLAGLVRSSLPEFTPEENSPLTLTGQREAYEVAATRVTSVLWVSLTQSEPVDAMDLADRVFGKPKSADSLKSQGNLLNRIGRQLNNRVSQDLAGLGKAKDAIKEAKADVAKRISEEPDKVSAAKYFADRRRKLAQATTTRKS